MRGSFRSNLARQRVRLELLKQHVDVPPEAANFYHCTRCKEIKLAEEFTQTSLNSHQCRACHSVNVHSCYRTKALLEPTTDAGQYCRAKVQVHFAERAFAELQKPLPDFESYSWCFACNRALKDTAHNFTMKKHQCRACSRAAKRPRQDAVEKLMARGYDRAWRFHKKHPQELPCFTEWNNRARFEDIVLRPLVERVGRYDAERANVLELKNKRDLPSLVNTRLVMTQPPTALVVFKRQRAEVD